MKALDQIKKAIYLRILEKKVLQKGRVVHTVQPYWCFKQNKNEIGLWPSAGGDLGVIFMRSGLEQ